MNFKNITNTLVHNNWGSKSILNTSVIGQIWSFDLVKPTPIVKVIYLKPNCSLLGEKSLREYVIQNFPIANIRPHSKMDSQILFNFF